jgi:hypothetical protein
MSDKPMTEEEILQYAATLGVTKAEKMLESAVQTATSDAMMDFQILVCRRMAVSMLANIMYNDVYHGPKLNSDKYMENMKQEILDEIKHFVESGQMEQIKPNTAVIPIDRKGRKVNPEEMN